MPHGVIKFRIRHDGRILPQATRGQACGEVLQLLVELFRNLWAQNRRFLILDVVKKGAPRYPYVLCKLFHGEPVISVVNDEPQCCDADF